MGAVGLVFGAKLRRYWRSWLLLTVLIGIAAGQASWRAFAVSLGVVPAPVVHAGPIAVIAAGVLVTANVLAAIPALSAARARPGRARRAE